MEYCKLFSQIRQLSKMGKQEKVKKMYNISPAAPYCSDVVINFAMLNAFLLKRSVAPGRVISILARKHESQISSMTLAIEIGG